MQQLLEKCHEYNRSDGKMNVGRPAAKWVDDITEIF